MRSFFMITGFSAALVAGQVGLASPSLVQECPAAQLSPRIVAIGDVHGDLSGLQAILKETGLLDGDGSWIGGKSILVLTGDLLDRGADDRGVLELLIALKSRARKAGGRVEVLLGNHEVMNLFGDLRYVTPESFARFADDKSEKRRENAYREYQRFLKAKAHFFHSPSPEMDEAVREEWFSQHPPGYLEHRAAFSASGRYGKWLRKKDAIRREGGYIFLHGGLDPALTPDLERLNQIIHRKIKTYDKIRGFLETENLILPFHDYTEALSLAENYAEHLRARGYLLQPAEQDRLQYLEALTGSTSWLSVHSNGPL